MRTYRPTTLRNHAENPYVKPHFAASYGSARRFAQPLHNALHNGCLRFVHLRHFLGAGPNVIKLSDTLGDTLGVSGSVM